MKKFIVCFIVLLMSAATAFAADDEREEDRVKDAGTVLKEILNIRMTFRKICSTKPSA